MRKYNEQLYYLYVFVSFLLLFCYFLTTGIVIISMIFSYIEFRENKNMIAFPLSYDIKEARDLSEER